MSLTLFLAWVKRLMSVAQRKGRVSRTVVMTVLKSECKFFRRKNVAAGDTTAVTIDGPIDSKSQDFEITTQSPGKIADAKVDAKTVNCLDIY